MAGSCSSTNKGVFSAVVYANKQIGQRFYRLTLQFEGVGSKAFAKAEPGQFAQLDLADAPLPPVETIPDDLVDVSKRKVLLRRPFSFADVTAKQDTTFVDILHCVVGPATLRMTRLSPGDSVSVIGPLGNGFCLPKDKKKTLLVAGGMGAGPLEHLAKVLTADCPDIEVIAFAGAKTAKELPFQKRLDEISQQLGFSLAEFARYGVKSLVATDDGSAGFAGPVTDCLSEWLGRSDSAGKDMIIYSCGPEAMLAKVAKIAEKQKIDCQVSMERMMACGIGLCQSCAVECKTNGLSPVRSKSPSENDTASLRTSNGASETVYKLCCEDGPVFDSREVVF